MFAWVAISIGLELSIPPSPERSRLNDLFLAVKRGSQPHFFLEVYEEVTKSWKATFTARSCLSTSSVLTTPGS